MQEDINIINQYMKNKKTKLYVILLLGLGLKTVNAQVTVTSLGGNAASSSGTASYSVGQLVFNTTSGSTGSVSQGVQQPYEISVVLGLEETIGINLNLNAYPNPTTDFITLKVNNGVSTELSYQIFDINGRILANKEVSGNETNIDLGKFTAATYFLRVFQNKKQVKTFKIIKN